MFVSFLPPGRAGAHEVAAVEIVVPRRHYLGVASMNFLRSAILAAWGPDTCDPHDLANWRAENPARGQCGTTALVVQDLLGGQLIMGEVHVDGVKVGHHWWNRLPDGSTVDLTAEQFHPGETVIGGELRHRPPDAPRRCRGQYELMRHRVLDALAENQGLAAVRPGLEGAAGRPLRLHGPFARARRDGLALSFVILARRRNPASGGCPEGTLSPARPRRRPPSGSSPRKPAWSRSSVRCGRICALI